MKAIFLVLCIIPFVLSQQCAPDADWPATPKGTIFRKKCSEFATHKGEYGGATRSCSDSGGVATWGLPDFSYCQILLPTTEGTSNFDFILQVGKGNYDSMKTPSLKVKAGRSLMMQLYPDIIYDEEMIHVFEVYKVHEKLVGVQFRINGTTSSIEQVYRSMPPTSEDFVDAQSIVNGKGFNSEYAWKMTSETCTVNVADGTFTDYPTKSNAGVIVVIIVVILVIFLLAFVGFYVWLGMKRRTKKGGSMQLKSTSHV